MAFPILQAGTFYVILTYALIRTKPLISGALRQTNPLRSLTYSGHSLAHQRIFVTIRSTYQIRKYKKAEYIIKLGITCKNKSIKYN